MIVVIRQRRMNLGERQVTVMLDVYFLRGPTPGDLVERDFDHLDVRIVNPSSTIRIQMYVGRRCWGHGSALDSAGLPLSQSNNSNPLRYLFSGNQFALAGARADVASAFPGFGRGDVAFPKWPGTALARANGIHRTARFAVPKYTVAVGFLAQADAVAHGPCVHLGRFVDTFPAVRGDGGDFLHIDPDVARRSGAAVAAARAFETQAVLVPRF